MGAWSQARLSRRTLFRRGAAVAMALGAVVANQRTSLAAPMPTPVAVPGTRMRLGGQQRDYWPTSEWRMAEPEAVGMRSAMLNEIREFGEDPESLLGGIAVVRHGYLVCEQHFRGFHTGSYYTINSITKSILSTLVGNARGSEYPAALDQPVAPWFPEMARPAVDPLARQITLRHLLTMTAGWTRLGVDDLTEFALDPSFVATIVARPLADEPGAAFRYVNGSNRHHGVTRWEPGEQASTLAISRTT